MTFLLALETCFTHFSVALHDGAQERYAYTSTAPNQHAEGIMPAVAQALESCGATYHDITHIAVTVGPGSFTGLRVGLAAAQGMAIAAGMPILGCSTLEIITHTARTLPVLAVIDARREQAYAQVFSEKNTTPQLMQNETIPTLVNGPFTLAGQWPEDVETGLQKRGHPFIKHAALPTASHLADFAVKRLAEGRPFLPAEPLYLRPPDAKLPSRKV